ncbi:hypothetical protein ODS41_05105 [Pyrobaculum sp. 3827-6]|uniref:hypothetical protein n=1 Tax=Pyrobaculum sp. 3827-6 TaxID=2983604 RepID=UPI0021DB7F81|nr:hypothetical protein [Pyrobaculum sp. 3827-6]MCU7787298.1 hypothetical protein [Pyrobaculum sp. 3827-6]
MEIYIIFRGEPPPEWKQIPGIKAVKADELDTIEGRFALVVGDEELARRLGVGVLTEEEARELLQHLKRQLGAAQ